MKYTVHELDEMRTLIRQRAGVEDGHYRSQQVCSNGRFVNEPYFLGNTVADRMNELMADEKKLVTYMMNGTTAAELLAELDAFEEEKKAAGQKAYEDMVARREAEAKAAEAFKQKVKRTLDYEIFNVRDADKSTPEKKLSLIEKWLGK
jgi:hypothetical protein